MAVLRISLIAGILVCVWMGFLASPPPTDFMLFRFVGLTGVLLLVWTLMFGDLGITGSADIVDIDVDKDIFDDEEDEEDEDDVRLVSPNFEENRVASIAIYDAQGRIVASVTTDEEGDCNIFTALGFTALVSREFTNDVHEFPVKDRPILPVAIHERGPAGSESARGHSGHPGSGGI